MSRLEMHPQRWLSWPLMALMLSLAMAAAVTAQATRFTYQGRLSDASNASQPANGTYDLQFGLYDAQTGGTQQPQPSPVTVTQTGVTVTNGVFTTQLDFGATAFSGADRFLEIRVKKPGDATYTTLSPRQQITSAPYAVRAASATNADNATAAQTATNATNAQSATNATTAQNATQLGGVAANQYVQTNDSRMSDARSPTAGSANYIQNTTAQQSSSNFNISGNGTAGGTLAANTVNATTQYNLGGGRILGNGGNGTNLFAGANGPTNTTGGSNSFFGASAGPADTTGAGNSFFGYGAGYTNTTGNRNFFAGVLAGNLNTTGNSNSFVGEGAGEFNTTGSNNSFVGSNAGNNNTTGSSNTIIGASADLGLENLTNATAIGAGAIVSNSDSVVLGRSADTVRIPGNLSVTGPLTANAVNSATQYNIGGSRVLAVNGAGGQFSPGNVNTFAGLGAGASITLNNFGTTGLHNSFFGFNSGGSTTSGTGNTFVGKDAGDGNTLGSNNTVIGRNAGGTNTLGNNNTLIGRSADVGSNNLTNATAIGSFASVTQSNSLVLGSITGVNNAPADTNVGIGTTAPTSRLHVVGNGTFSGNLSVAGTLSKGAGSFKIDHPLDPANRYLYHSFVESPDMMNVYNGNTVTDQNGQATVTLPGYFEALNRDFRYQLTVIGQFAQAIVAQEIRGNQFVIRTNVPMVKVSWQVTGIRHDKFADDNRIQAEVPKPAGESGTCIYQPACGE